MAGRPNKALDEYMSRRFVDRVLDETEEGQFLKRALEDKEDMFREYLYCAYTKLGNIGLGAFVSLFYEDGYVYPERKRMSEYDPVEWSKRRKVVFERDDFTCVYCGKRGDCLEVDHKIPFIKGGSDEIENLVTSCVRCNRQKRDKTYEEYRERRRKNGRETKKAN